MLKLCSITLLSSLCIASTVGAQAAPPPAPTEPSTAAAPSEPAPTVVPAPEAPVNAPVVLPAEPPPSAAVVVEPAPAPAPAPNADLPSKLAVGTEGFFKPGINLQGWFQFDDRSAYNSSTKDYVSAYTFRLRRAEISAKGEILPGLLGYAVMVDPARVLETQNKTIDVTQMGMKVGSVIVNQPVSPISILQDFFITLQSDYLDASLGQFKIPVSYEGYTSASKLMFPERHSVSRFFGDKRDIGIRLAKTFKYMSYSAGIFNGNGQNNLDNNHAKDGALRLDFYPIEGLTVAVVGYATLYDRKQPTAKDRYEADLRFEKAGFTFLGEIIGGNDIGIGGVKTKSFGTYGAVGYKFPFNLEVVFRIGYLDPNTKDDIKPTDKVATTDELTQMDIGLNYYLKGNEVKFQLAYTQFAYQTVKNSNQFIFAAQASY